MRAQKYALKNARRNERRYALKKPAQKGRTRRAHTNNMKRCRTPGCFYNEFHSGLHSFENTSLKRVRVECSIPKTVLVDSVGVESYDSICKAGHRSMFVEIARITTGPLLYLEAVDGSLTNMLLSRGIDASRLNPLNNSLSVVELLQTKFPNVNVRFDDLLSVCEKVNTETFSAVWFDMVSVGFGNYNIKELVHCAEYKLWTLSSRKFICADKLNTLTSALTQARERIVTSSVYTGRVRGCGALPPPEARQQPLNWSHLHGVNQGAAGV